MRAQMFFYILPLSDCDIKRGYQCETWPGKYRNLEETAALMWLLLELFHLSANTGRTSKFQELLGWPELFFPSPIMCFTSSDFQKN
jgi:hypothetical protein